MKRAIRRNGPTAVALLLMFALATFTAGYVLEHQGLRLPLINGSTFQIQADLSDAKAITPGQGQTVRVSGIEIGDIAGVRLTNGHALVTLNIDPKYRDLIHTDATALVRPRTGLDDMFVELDPGSNSAPLIHPGYTIPLANTLPPVNNDEILQSLDSDTRDYLDLLLGGAAQGLRGNAFNLRDIFRRLGPTHQDLARFATAVATRRANLRRLIHSLNLLNAELARRGPETTQLIDDSAVALRALASQQEGLAQTIHDLPPALAQSTATLDQVRSYATLLGPTATRLVPVFRALNDSNYAVRPFVAQATPIVRQQIRPFVVGARPLVRDLRPAARALATATPQLSRVFVVLNHLFNMLAFNQDGERLPPSDPNRREGFLFWIAWLGHQSVNLFSTEDANGTFRPVMVGATCQTFDSVVNQFPPLEFLENLTPLLTSPQGCNLPPSQLPSLSARAAGLVPASHAKRRGTP